MENSGKRTKLSIDPFERIPVELHDSIIQYLTSKDVINAVLVSKDWNRIIVSSKAAMDKIILKLDETNSSRKDMKGLMASKRKYTNLKINKTFKNENRQAIYGILQKFKDCLEQLFIYFDVQMHQVKLEKLRILNLYSEKFYKDGILSAAPNLIFFASMDDKERANIEAIFNCEKLKYLILSHNIWLYLLRLDPLPAIKFQLKEFNWYNWDYALVTPTNYLTFLLHQTAFIKIIRIGIDHLTTQEVFDAVMTCPALNCLHIRASGNLEAMFQSPSSAANFSVTHLILVGGDTSLTWLLKYLPNLTRIELWLCNRPILRNVIQNAPNLKQLKIFKWLTPDIKAISSEHVPRLAYECYTELMLENEIDRKDLEIAWMPDYKLFEFFTFDKY